jgi:hypothetical protein
VKLRRKLFPLLIIILSAFLVILIPAILSHSGDIRYEGSFNSGIPLEPSLVVIEKQISPLSPPPPLDSMLQPYIVFNTNLYPKEAAINQMKQLRNKGFSAFLIHDSHLKDYYHWAVGPFLTSHETQRVLYSLHLSPSSQTTIIKIMPTTNILFYEE